MATLIVPGDIVEIVWPGRRGDHDRVVRAEVHQVYRLDGVVEIAGHRLDEDPGREHTMRVPEAWVRVIDPADTASDEAMSQPVERGSTC